MDKMLKGADYLLLLFYLPGKTSVNCEPIEGRTRITKMMFLFNEEVYKYIDLYTLTPSEYLPKFEAYHYGPFSKDVHQQLDLFVKIGFLDEKEREISNDEEVDLMDDRIEIEEDDDFLIDKLYVTEYVLSDKGKNFVEERILNQLEDFQIEYLTMYKEKINSIALSELLSYVYNKYPNYAEKSRIRNKVK
ncbi:hypothetical protein [Bacillus cereus]|uniref:hypothetical protein n=1 Tax=Bacillus cereus TaxID=1396 RepID=UPI001D0E48CD|nr:hypothetical protein [Bacillus cereus]MCC2384764.1 hypothetical protein [Bacillus cereus]